MREVTKSVFAKKKLEKAVNLCCDYWNVDPTIVFTKARDRHLMNARHSIRYMLTLEKGLTLAQIGGLTNCDHSNVVHSKSAFLNLAQVDDQFGEMKRLILGEETVNREISLRNGIHRIIFSEIPPTKQVRLICELIKERNHDNYEDR